MEQNQDANLTEFPDGILPPDVEQLICDIEKVNKQSYSIMEWWCLITSSDSAHVGSTEFKVFYSWGKCVSLIALYVL